MLDDKNELRKLISSIVKYFETEGNLRLVEILTHSDLISECINYDNWNGGTYTYGLYVEIDVELFMSCRNLIDNYEKDILAAIDVFLRGVSNKHFSKVVIRPKRKQYLNWTTLLGKADKKEILATIAHIKNIMIAVSTGGPGIQDENTDYIGKYKFLDECFTILGLENPNPYKNLWDWHGRWRQEDLSTYASRRAYIPSLYEKTIEFIEESAADAIGTDYTPTGWERVDRTIHELKKRLADAANEEQFQTIGMLGRDAIITVAQQVYVFSLHKTEDGVVPSNADAKRMLDAYFACELSGQSNERIRRYSKSTLDLANNLTHDRLATRRDAALCLTAVISLTNIVKIISQDAEILF